MKSPPLVIVLTAAVLAGAAAQDGGASGLALLRDCEEVLRASGDPVRASRCNGLVRGAARTLALLQQDGRLSDAPVCLPDDTPDPRLVQVVVGYLSEHPDELHLPDVRLVMAALGAAYPCP